MLLDVALFLAVLYLLVIICCGRLRLATWIGYLALRRVGLADFARGIDYLPLTVAAFERTADYGIKAKIDQLVRQQGSDQPTDAVAPSELPPGGLPSQPLGSSTIR